MGEGVEDDLDVLDDDVDGVRVGGAGGDGGVGWVLDGAGGESDDFGLARDIEGDDGVAGVGGDGGGEDVLVMLVRCQSVSRRYECGAKGIMAWSDTYVEVSREACARQEKCHFRFRLSCVRFADC